jgi:hypothetical protein
MPKDIEGKKEPINDNHDRTKEKVVHEPLILKPLESKNIKSHPNEAKYKKKHQIKKQEMQMKPREEEVEKASEDNIFKINPDYVPDDEVPLLPESRYNRN